MERLFGQFAEILKTIRPRYITELETQAGRFVSEIKFGRNNQKLLDARDKGLLLYHQGPEKKVIPGFFAKDVPTGKECVFIEYHHLKAAYHLVGNVDTAKQFTLLRIEQSQDDKGYLKVSLMKNQEIIREVTEILQNIESPQAPEI